jgi:P-type E1-E2 ATPase
LRQPFSSTQAVDLVVGDLVLLEQGVRVPADIRVVLSNGLKIDRSMLTGESEPAELSAELDAGTGTSMLTASNMCFMGCEVSEVRRYD